MTLLRAELGEVLRDLRMEQGRTLREISRASAVSLGYLSEIERGTKEASSELLLAICVGLEVPLSAVLSEVAQRVARVEAMSAPVALPLALAPDVSASAA